ncbi:MAG: hypothetical protein NXH87_11885 [Rhodobiaceae bacterium]|nr:hypothetical protein [Rhodobiaceae bacterium]
MWQIVGGAEKITMSLLEAEDLVDTGRIWRKETIDVPKHALWDEINDLIFSAELKLMSFAVDNFSMVTPTAQADDVEATYYPKRSPADSEIDPQLTIDEQFDLMRVCDPNRFPAYFDMNGHRYVLRLEKVL